jgi:CubicO group peptidase (beta-lactamase class C family)
VPERCGDLWFAVGVGRYTDDLFYEFMADYTFGGDAGLHIRRQYWYSNCAFGLLASALTALQGTTFAALMRSLVFAPLGMARSSLVTDSEPNDAPTSLAVGHDVDGSPRDFGTSPETVLGSWAIRSTARDLLTFLAASLLAARAPGTRGEDV